MAVNPTFLVTARLRGFDSIGNSLSPGLRAFVEFRVSHRAGVAHQYLRLPDKTSIGNLDSVYVQALSAGLYWRTSHQDNPGKLLALGTIDPAGPGGTTVELDGEFTNPVQILFPLSRSEIVELEDLRSGGDVRYTIKVSFRGHARRMAATASVLEPCWIDPLEVSDDRSNTLFEIPKSKWIESYLPLLRLGKWKVVELPQEDLPTLKEADEQLAEAQRHFDAGEWRACVVASRVVIQDLEPKLRDLTSPAFSDRPNVKSAEDAATKAAKLTQAFTNLSESMLSFQREIFGLVSSGAHPLPPEATLERPDAELAMGLALLCRRYVGLRFVAAVKK